MAKLEFRAATGRGLIGYCKAKLDEAKREYEQHRKAVWEEIEQYWKAEFKDSMRTRESERAKVVTPTTQVSVDTASAELDSLLGYDEFIDMEPVVGGGEPPAEWSERFGRVFDQIREGVSKDLLDTGSRAEISKAIFWGSMLGAGVLKVVTEDKADRVLVPAGNGMDAAVEERIRTVTSLRAVNPHLFYPQPGADSIESAEYVIEAIDMPEHEIRERIRLGVYNPVDIPARATTDEQPKVYEYHGLVPLALLSEAKVTGFGLDRDTDALDALTVADTEDGGMVMALVVWMDGVSEPLWAGEYPYLDGEKSYKVFGYDRSCGGIFGRGVGHKVRNVQKAQDGNLRAKLDALSYAIHPMIGINSMSLISRRRMRIGPGKQLLFNGRPSEAVEMFRLGDVPQSAFLASQELAQMAEASSGLQNFGGVRADYQSAAGLDVLGQAAINRNRKILEGLTDFLSGVLRLFVWRSVQFNPEKYPPVFEDVRVLIATRSITRRQEMAQISNMLKTVPDSSPAYWKLLIKYFELSDLPDKNEVVADIQRIAAAVLNPQPQQPSIQEQVLLRQIELEERKSEVSLRLQAERVRAELVRAAAALERIDSEEVRNKAAAILSIARAEAEEIGQQLAAYKAVVDQLTQEARGTDELYTQSLYRPGGAAGRGPGGQAVNPGEDEGMEGSG